MTGVQFPAMRNEVLVAVRALADPEYQWRVWVRCEYPHANFYDDFTQKMNMLDDLAMREDPGAIGDVLRNPEEAQAMQTLADMLGKLFDEHGYGLSDEEYLNTSEWPDVVSAARIMLNSMTAP